MRFRFDSNFDRKPFDMSSYGRGRFPAHRLGDEPRRDAARGGHAESEAAAALRDRCEPQVRRAVRRVLSRRTCGDSRLARRVRDEVRRVLQSMPGAAADAKRLEDVVTARLCRAILSQCAPPRGGHEALKDTVRY